MPPAIWCAAPGRMVQFAHFSGKWLGLIDSRLMPNTNGHYHDFRTGRRAGNTAYDLGGPALKKAAEGHGWEVIADALVPDEKREIQRAVRELIARGLPVGVDDGRDGRGGARCDAGSGAGDCGAGTAGIWRDHAD